jgi:hypothetical protein
MKAAPLLALLTLGCIERGEPPGAVERESARGLVVASESTDSARPAASATAPPGSIADALPFAPTGERGASIAWRTWIYTDVGPNRTRYGYLRAGATFDVRGPAIRNDGCQGGWHRVNPRGFVCMAKRAVRGEGLPYLYALSNDTSPLLYFRLPATREMMESEGDFSGRTAILKERLRGTPLETLLEAEPPPEFLLGGNKLVKPHGVNQPLRFLYHAGPANPESGFAVSRTFEWEARLFGLTTELDLIALDRTKPVVPSRFQGIALGENDTLPVAFARSPVNRYSPTSGGAPLPGSTIGFREPVLLTGKKLPRGMLEVSDGTFVAESAMRVIPRRTSFPSFATGDRKWVDVSVKEQSLVAYVGRKPVYVTLVSTGRSGLMDPEETDATVRGSFMIYQKDVSSTMDGDEDRSDSFNLHDVPFVQYFHKGYALHGTYWHDDFGKPRSHGCVNLAPVDAAWLFEWTDPSVPPEWHGVLNKERGTVVLVRP